MLIIYWASFCYQATAWKMILSKMQTIRKPHRLNWSNVEMKWMFLCNSKWKSFSIEIGNSNSSGNGSLLTTPEPNTYPRRMKEDKKNYLFHLGCAFQCVQFMQASTEKKGFFPLNLIFRRLSFNDIRIEIGKKKKERKKRKAANRFGRIRENLCHQKCCT